MNSLPGEEWRPIPGYPGYDVSDKGRVRSYRAYGQNGCYVTDKPQRILKTWLTDGYPYVSVYDANGKPKGGPVHSLVMLAFVGPRPEGMDVCHNDGDRGNCVLENLRYDTRSANIQDMVEHGTAYRAVDRDTAAKIQEEYEAGVPLPTLSEKYDVPYDMACSIGRGNTHPELGGYAPKFRGHKVKGRNTVLLEKDIIDMRIKRASGNLLTDIADELGIHWSTVSDYCTGRLRPDIAGPLAKGQYGTSSWEVIRGS